MFNLKHLGLAVLATCAVAPAQADVSSSAVGQLIWQDEFDTLNTNVWNVVEGNGCQYGPDLCGWGNQELQSYSQNNVYIENGNLVLEARNVPENGSAFTSGKVDSQNNISIQYGMIEVRMQVPDVGIGLWPAAWLLGTSPDAWPRKGEIDMMEMGHKRSAIDEISPGADINSFVGSNVIFYADAACVEGNPTCAAMSAWQTDNAHISSTPLTNRFVTYRTYWTEQEIRFTVIDNGVEYDLYDSPVQLTEEADEIRAPFYLLLNLAVGGNFTDALSSEQVTAPLPAKMYIDYVRVYELDGQGQVWQGAPPLPPAEEGTFGVFTDTTTTNNKLEAEVSSDIYIWNTNSVSAGSTPAYEGANVIAWQYTSSNEWFGGGVQARGVPNMSNFANGSLDFKIKIPADVAFKVGIADAYTNQNWIDFPAHQNQYGMIRDGEWTQVSIPMSDMRGELIALQAMKGMFYIANSDSQLPTAPFEFAIDDIVWSGGTSNGLTPQVVKFEAEDYINYFDTSAGNAGGQYRTDDVDIEITTDTGGGYNVGWTESGEWLEYSAEFAAGDYQLTARVASQVGGGQFYLSVAGQNSATAQVDATGGWQTFVTTDLGTITIPADGDYTVRIQIEQGLANINWIEFQPIVGCQSLSCMDSDSDGVTDDIDQCPATPAGASVDTNGCEFPTSGACGIQAATDTSLTFYCNAQWADLHYRINNGGQLNVMMSSNGSQMLYTVDNINPGDSLWYFFTHEDNGLAKDTDAQTYTFAGASNPNPDPQPDPDPEPTPTDSDNDGVPDAQDQCANTPAGTQVDANGCPVNTTLDADGDGVADSQDQCPNTPPGDSVNAQGCTINIGQIQPLFDANTPLEPATVYDRGDAIITRLADRGRDRHAKDSTQNDHYDHYLAHYWHFRTARIQLEDYVAKGGSTIEVTFITEWELSVYEFRAWFWGVTATGQFHHNMEQDVVNHGSGTWDNNFVKVSDQGHQWKYTVSIQNKWLQGGQQQIPLAAGQRMEFELSQFLTQPPEGSRLNYYGTTYLYIVGEGGLKPFKWDVNSYDDGYPIEPAGLLGGDTTLGYNYTNEPAGRFMQMATNLSHVNGQAFVEGRRVHHTNFEDGIHDERFENGQWPEQVGKVGTHYIQESCSGCHVRNGRAFVADVGQPLDKWVFKVGDAQGYPDPFIGRVLQPQQIGNVTSEGDVTLGNWTELGNGLRQPNYVFSNGTPATFSARIAPNLVGLGLLEAVAEETILAWADPDDTSSADGISGKASIVTDPVTGATRLGRFGYKAATADVKHQVAAAFNTDMGVMTSVLPTPDCGSQQTTCGNTQGSELADEDLDDLVKYISLLGVPARRDLDNTQTLQGESLFNNLGCGGCHRAEMQTSAYHPLAELRNQTIRPYTDMLLHDMGPGLADSLGEGSATGSEWRTAPLWGLGHTEEVMLGDLKGNDQISIVNAQERAANQNRIGYLHDGRARTIDEAIRWHGGEAENSKNAYEALSQADKEAVLAFLRSL
ncbi:di-heme oxidoredictase family protein [Catenovulum sp. SX2]|uniref:di-heme oxidoredictase family protein n=1 Tax=Catenovulum sp. SX2 TaxID=3398614 RepID=UPI003F873C4F